MNPQFFHNLAQDIYSATMVKMASISSAIEKSAASNLRSDLVLGRLTDATKNTLMSTPRYSRSNPGQILADIKSSLRGRGNDAGALTQELKNRGIPYKVRGKGLSSKDIELDLSSGHDILNTPYLPSNYSESFANNNVKRRLNNAIDSARDAGYYHVRADTEYNSPGVRHSAYSVPDKKFNDIRIGIPASVYHGRGKKYPEIMNFRNTGAGAILHETDELNQVIQQGQNYDRAIRNLERGPNLYTTGEYPGVIKPTKRTSAQNNVKPLPMYSDDNNMSPYTHDGGNNHTSATILMNELMDQHASHVGRKPEALDFDDILSTRMEGVDNPVNRMTGIDLTSSEQPFVPRNIAKNKKEYLKRIRTVNKAENALQREHLRKMKQFEDMGDTRSQLYSMLDDQMEMAARKEINHDFFNAFPQGIKEFNNISDFDKFMQENPLAEQYIKENDRGILRQRKNLATDVNEEYMMSPKAKRFLDSINYFIGDRRDDLLREYMIDTPGAIDYYLNARDHIDKIQNRRGHRMVGDSQQNMDFLVNYLRNKGMAV